jgi:hydroxymethylpyrimidine pyrophosphatase-like HAD family hydrolase
VTQPPFALLADVDGPISNPDAKSIINARIVPAITSLLKNGIPIVFNTGRSADFVQKNVLDPVLKARPQNLHLLHGVCEKGAVWLSFEDDGEIQHVIDETIAVPKELQPKTRALVDEKYADVMFYDDTKESMISVERRPDVDHDTYQHAQPTFVADLDAMIREAGFGVTRPGPDARNGDATLQIDPSIISVDLESVKVGKDLGAERAFELLKESHPVRWRTIGDSAVDYAMSDWLHERGFDVAHIDVGPKREKQKRPYDVLIANKGIHDDAGGAYLEWLAKSAAQENPGPEHAFY